MQLTFTGVAYAPAEAEGGMLDVIDFSVMLGMCDVDECLTPQLMEPVLTSEPAERHMTEDRQTPQAFTLVSEPGGQFAHGRAPPCVAFNAASGRPVVRLTLDRKKPGEQQRRAALATQHAEASSATT